MLSVFIIIILNIKIIIYSTTSEIPKFIFDGVSQLVTGQVVATNPDFVVRLGAHGVQSGGESFIEAVGKEVDLGPNELSDQGAGLIRVLTTSNRKPPLRTNAF
jgi:hypothetical protein